tara:strand:+ start:252 stop:446 length:195 start_codon:yes stop_codon:yes gene_type:complete
METLEQTLRHTHDWTIERVEFLSKEDRHDDAFCIVQEFCEWLDPDAEDHDIFSMEYIGKGSKYD